MPPASASADARRFGKYELVAKLATGGMAEIFLARILGDGEFEKLVCIKRILPHLAKDPTFVTMFLDEARVAARISHPNVCQVFELGEWHGAYYIAMEYLEGVPLSCFRRTDYYPIRPDPRLVAGIGVQACEGLHHAHQLKGPKGDVLGVVHRDISAQNLFVTVDGVVKVLDFGIAKATDAKNKTSTGAMKGTYMYMSPEQLRNEKVDRRSDVWALGIVLWETLAQQHLFKRETEFLTFQAITHEPIPDIQEVRPDVPPLLADTLARALARNRDDRYASARAFGEALAQAVAPLGGSFGGPALSDEVQHAFAPMLGEQATMLRIAREGGKFDLENTSELVAHGTEISTTPVSNLRARIEEAQAEVAHFAKVRDALASLDDEPSLSGFTPPPEPMYARQSSGYEVQVGPERRSQPYPVAPPAWRNDQTPTPMPIGPRSQVIQVPAPPASKLPWIIAMVAVAVAAAAGAILYMKLGSSSAAETTTAAASPPAVVPMHVQEPATPPAPPDAAPADAAPVVETPDAAQVPTIAEETPKPKKPETVPHPVVHVQQPPPPPPPPPPVEKVTGPPGFITIDSSPVYSVIFIDGKKLGETPLVHIQLPPGKHAVKAVSPSGAIRTTSITIESGKTAPVRRIEW
jgi:serine/threonine-protein kinase